MPNEKFDIGLKRCNVTVTGKDYRILSAKHHHYKNATFYNFCMSCYKSTARYETNDHCSASWAAMIFSIITRKDLTILKSEIVGMLTSAVRKMWTKIWSFAEHESSFYDRTHYHHNFKNTIFLTPEKYRKNH